MNLFNLSNRLFRRCLDLVCQCHSGIQTCGSVKRKDTWLVRYTQWFVNNLKCVVSCSTMGGLLLSEEDGPMN